MAPFGSLGSGVVLALGNVLAAVSEELVLRAGIQLGAIPWIERDEVRKRQMVGVGGVFVAETVIYLLNH